MAIEEQIKSICMADNMAMQLAKKRWDSIAKPLGSLGKLEEAVIKIAGMTKNAKKVSIQKAGLLIMCSDHGVVEEGVTQTGSEVTKIVSENFVKGETSAAVMAHMMGIDIFPIDIGINCECYADKTVMPSVLIDRKVAKGTKNLVKEPAMTEEECRQALQVGIDLVHDLKKMGYEIIATGEMGIGNTTPSSALAAFLLGKEVEEVTGRGAGLSKEGMEKKIKAIKSGLKRFQKEAKTQDIITLLSHLGGYDIVGMTGVFLGGAIERIPILVDGFISSVAALAAQRIEPKAADYMLASHRSKEPAGNLILEAIGGDAFLDCNMCLGEGTGAIAVIPLLQMAVKVYMEMSTFQEIEMEEYKPLL